MKCFTPMNALFLFLRQISCLHQHEQIKCTYPDLTVRSNSNKFNLFAVGSRDVLYSIWRMPIMYSLLLCVQWLMHVRAIPVWTTELVKAGSQRTSAVARLATLVQTVKNVSVFILQQPRSCYLFLSTMQYTEHAKKVVQCWCIIISYNSTGYR